MKLRSFFLRHTPRKILDDRAKRLRARAQAMPAGAERDELLRQARQLEIRDHLEDWINSSGLQSPER